MKRTSSVLSVASFAVFALLLAVSATAHAQTQTCSYTFTSGSGISYLKFCATVNGNIAQFESPAGVEQLFVPATLFGTTEGYGLCDGSTNTGYFDYAWGGGDSGNWGDPTLVSQTATSVKIERTTSDGLWTLTQTITSVAGTTPYAKLAMALKNNSGTTKNANLVRVAGFQPWDAGSTGDYYIEYYAGTNESTFGWLESGTSGHSLYFGLKLQNIGNVTPLSALRANVGFPINYGGAVFPCTPTTGEASGPTYMIINNSGEGVYLYELTVKPGETVTVTDRYLSF